MTSQQLATRNKGTANLAISFSNGEGGMSKNLPGSGAGFSVQKKEHALGIRPKAGIQASNLGMSGFPLLIQVRPARPSIQDYGHSMDWPRARV